MTTADDAAVRPGPLGAGLLLGTYVLFFLSGFSSLLYQIVWQRALFTIYGINIESVTVVVTAFMIGLGAGSLAGGAISKDARRPVLLFFAAAEIGIGLFGFSSLTLFHWVGGFTLAMSPVATAAVTFLLVLFPTVLMGGTLPLLVAYLVRRSGNVGRSVGVLYFVNTLGAAAASILAVVVILGKLGLSGSVTLAAAVNCVVGASVLAIHRRARA